MIGEVFSSDIDVLNDESTPEKLVDDSIAFPDDEIKDDIQILDTKEKEIKDENEDDKENKEDEEEPELRIGRPTAKDITKAFPEVFKKFPELRQAYYESEQFRELYHSVDDAKEAKEKSENFDYLADQVTSGTKEGLKGFLEAIEQTQQGSINSFASNILDTIKGINQDSYFRAITPVLESALQNAYNEGSDDENSPNHNLRAAALVISKYLFNTYDIAKGKKFYPEQAQEDPTIKRKREELDNREKEFTTRAYNTMNQEINGSISHNLRESIIKGFDPNNVFNEELKDILVDRIFSETDKALSSNTKHVKYMNDLWLKAKNSNFAPEWKSKIIRAYLEASKSIMPGIRNRIRSKALGQKVKDIDRTQRVANIDSGRKEPRGGAAPSQNRQALNSKAINYYETSDMDILNDKITFKK